jgi:hypothetical protein
MGASPIGPEVGQGRAIQLPRRLSSFVPRKRLREERDNANEGARYERDP